ncbi:MAG: hypothetical protein ABW007_09720 [Chitinophagaceae bacterium]
MTKTEVEDIIQQLGKKEAEGSRLGTPVLDLSAPAFVALVAHGSVVVPYLVSILQTAASRQAAWIVAALRLINDPSAERPLRDACARVNTVDVSDEWDYALRGECHLALKQFVPDK